MITREIITQFIHAISNLHAKIIFFCFREIYSEKVVCDERPSACLAAYKQHYKMNNEQESSSDNILAIADPRLHL